MTVDANRKIQKSQINSSLPLSCKPSTSSPRRTDLKMAQQRRDQHLHNQSFLLFSIPLRASNGKSGIREGEHREACQFWLGEWID